MSRYYDPVTHRFLNADGYFQSGGDILDTNMSSYCRNNPINNSDSTGEFILESSFVIVALVAVATLMTAYITIKAVSAIGNLVKIGISRAKSSSWSQSNTKSKSGSRTDTGDIATSKPAKSSKIPTAIYRYGGTNPGNLTPKQKDKYTGLSFSTVPMPGAAKTTIEEINATGVVYAVQDKPFHISVKPVDASVEDWINEGSSSVWTQAVKSVVIKWDGGN